MATAELAAALPALVAVLLVSVGLIAATSDALRCEDAARVAARSVARGDAAGVSTAFARRLAPPGAVIDLGPPAGGPTVDSTEGSHEGSGDSSGDLVSVRVRARVRMLGPLGAVLPSWTVTGSATALAEATS